MGMQTSPVPAPTMTPWDADCLESYWNWTIDWWWDEIIPDYSDVAWDDE